jgi:hypothetical protein
MPPTSPHPCRHAYLPLPRRGTDAAAQVGATWRGLQMVSPSLVELAVTGMGSAVLGRWHDARICRGRICRVTGRLRRFQLSSNGLNHGPQLPRDHPSELHDYPQCCLDAAHLVEAQVSDAFAQPA